MQINSADIIIPKQSNKYSKEDITEMQRVKSELTNAGKSINSTKALEGKPLQTDTLVLSEEALRKADEESKSKDFMTSNASEEKILSDSDQAAKDTMEQEKSLREAISKLTMEIMDISMRLQQLKSKDDAESSKESRSLETELAIKKGMLEAKVSQQLDLAKFS